MKKGAIAVCLLVAFAMQGNAQESILDRLAKLEEGNANINSIMATQARMKADLENVATDVKALREELKALRQAVLPNAKFTPSSDHTGWDAKAASFTNTPAAASWGVSAPTYSSQTMFSARSGPIRRLLGRGAGSCGAGG